MEDQKLDLPSGRLAEDRRVLLVQTGPLRCALPLGQVVEVMRPHAIDPLPDAPPWVQGLAVIRGATVPVIDLGVLLQIDDAPAAARLVVCRAAHRRVAIAVEAVLGLCEVGRAPGAPSSPDDKEGRLAVAVADEEIISLLRVADSIPEEMWQELEATAMAR